MSDYRQPWRRVEIGGRRCRLQILDPVTAFDVEPDLVRVFGDTLAFALSAPGELLGAVWKQAAAGASTASHLREMMQDPTEGPERTVETITALTKVLAECLTTANISPGWIAQIFRQVVLGRIEVDGEVLLTPRDWASTKLPPMAKWQAIAAQVQQTFGPLWMRKPYRLQVKARDYGVPQPAGVPKAARYAAELAKAGIASSAMEILDQWTPVRMIEMVEAQTYAVENERRAHEAARSGG